MPKYQDVQDLVEALTPDHEDKECLDELTSVRVLGLDPKKTLVAVPVHPRRTLADVNIGDWIIKK